MNFKKLFLGLSVLIALLAAAVGHVVYWYLPRARPGVPDAAGPMGRLLESDSFPVSLWMPYPHQNLAFLRGEAGAESEGLRAVARLAGLPTPALPSFGPLPVPPAVSLAIASDESGERYAIFAEVFPALAAFAKLAGRVAGNPWLRGGEIYVDGRRAEIRWQGNLWTVASPALPELPARTVDTASVEAGVEVPSLAVIRVQQAVHPLPSGRFLLLQRGDGLEIVSASAQREGGSEEFVLPALDALDLAGLDVFLFALSGPNPALGESAEALVGFASPPGGTVELPRVATLWAGGERRSLPGESILEIAGRRPREGEAAGWSIAALDSATLERGLQLAPRLAGLEDPDGGVPAWVVWFDLDRGLTEVSLLAERLGQVPIVPRQRLERWRDIHAALRPVARRYSRLSLVVTRDRVLRLRLDPPPPPRP